MSRGANRPPMYPVAPAIAILEEGLVTPLANNI